VDPDRLDQLQRGINERLQTKHESREQALPASRRAIRHCANAIRALHRGEFDEAGRLMAEARAAIDEGWRSTSEHPDVRYAGYIQDAEKEYAEARITEAVIQAGPLPGPEDCGVADAPYLGGMADAIGEGRRHVLDLLRAGNVDRGEQVLAAMEDMYSVLVTVDFPDAITGNLRRLTDTARSIIEKTRGDLSVAFVQRDLRDALERHAREVLGKE
jgi:translin